MGWVVPVLVCPLLFHSFLKPLLEAKLTLVTISPTIATMKLYGFRLRLRMGLLIWFLSTQLINRFLLTRPINWFLLTRVLTFFPKEHIPQGALELDRLLEIICEVREYGWIWVCVEFVS
jgi:hypothetical protein